jgi:hypothetical protein
MRRKQKMSSESQMIASFRLTNMLYRKAAIDSGYEVRRAIMSRGWVIKNLEDLTFDEVEKIKGQVSDLYLKYMLTCSDKTLKAILDAAEANICRRAGKTLEAIKTELFERVMNEEDSSKTKTINAS